MEVKSKVIDHGKIIENLAVELDSCDKVLAQLNKEYKLDQRQLEPLGDFNCPSLKYLDSQQITSFNADW